jgi:hypothetical protein
MAPPLNNPAIQLLRFRGNAREFEGPGVCGRDCCKPASLQAVRSCRVCRSVQYGSDALLRSCLLLWDNPIAAREGAGELEARPAEGVHSEGMTSFPLLRANHKPIGPRLHHTTP